MMEGFEDVAPTLVADGQPPEAAEPSQCALHDPAMPAEALAALDPAPGDPAGNAALGQVSAAARQVIGLVGVQLGRAPARPAPALPDRRHRVDQLREGNTVVSVGGGETECQRDAVRVREDVPLRSRTAPVGRVRAGAFAPLFAGTAAASNAARDQSIAFAAPKRSSSTRCSFSQIPASCQARSRRQQVMPQPQPISLGSISQGMPDLSTNRMPVSAARFGSGGRPPFGFGRSGGRWVTPFFAWGIYLDDYSSGTTVVGNIVARTVRGGYHNHLGFDNVCENNIFVDGVNQQAEWNGRSEMRRNTFRRNIVVWSSEAAAYLRITEADVIADDDFSLAAQIVRQEFRDNRLPIALAAIEGVAWLFREPIQEHAPRLTRRVQDLAQAAIDKLTPGEAPETEEPTENSHEAAE